MPVPEKRDIPKRQSAKMRVYCTLRDWITYGTLKPGERLNDQELSEYFETSRTPIREALQMLETQKLVVVYPNKGTVVSDIDLGNLRKCYLPLAHLHALAAQLACESIQEKQLEQLEQMDWEIMEYVQAEDVVGMLQRDLDFHNLILKIADNEFILQFSEVLMLHIQRFEHHLFSQSKNRVLNFTQHRCLLDALRRRDKEQAYRAMLENWLTTLERYDLDNRQQVLLEPVTSGEESNPLFVLVSQGKES